MPSPHLVGLERKLDQLSRQQPSTPKLLLDTLFLISAELGDRDKESARLVNRVAKLERGGSLPGGEHELRGLDELNEQLRSMKVDVAQLEGTIREAEISYAAHTSSALANLQAEIGRMETAADRIVNRVVPEALDSRIHHLATTLQTMEEAAVHVGRDALGTHVAQVIESAKRTVSDMVAAAIDQARDETEVISFSISKHLEQEWDVVKRSLKAAQRESELVIHRITDGCAAFVAGSLDEACRVSPFLELHELRGEILFCSSQLQFLSDAFQFQSHELQKDRLQNSVTRTPARGARNEADCNSTIDGDVDLVQVMRGFISLWDADDDILRDMASVSQNRTRHLPATPHLSRAAEMKRDYLLSLPVFQHLMHRDVDRRCEHEEQTPVALPTHTQIDASATQATVSNNTASPMRSSPQTTTPLQRIGMVVEDEEPLYGGVRITQVLAGSLAQDAGFKQNDQIVSLQRTLIDNKAHLESLIEEHRLVSASQHLTFHIHRPETHKTLVITIPLPGSHSLT